MSPVLQLLPLRFLSAPLASVLVVCAGVQAQSNQGLELMEARTALQVSGNRIAELEAALAKSQTQAAAYAESLAAANAELAQVRDDHQKLRMQMEGLGLAAIDSSNEQLQQNLLTALSDLRIVEQQKRILADSLLALSESAIAHAQSQSQSDSAALQNLKRSLEEAEQVLAGLRSENTNVASGSLQNASVVSLKEDLGFAILNVGSRQGVHPGMPFSIYRQDKPVARVLVVDVRGGVSGAVVQELVNQNDPVKIGDTGKVEPGFKG